MRRRPLACHACLMVMYSRSQARGSSFATTSFVFVTLLVQLLLAALAGMGGALVPGSPLAACQIGATCLLQAAAAAYVLGLGPAADRVENVVVGWQYALEACGTLLLVYSSGVLVTPSDEVSDALPAVRFYLCLGSMALPIVQKVYDGVVVQMCAASAAD